MEQPNLVFDRYELRTAERRLLRDGKPVAISGKCFDLLAILIEHRGATVSRERLYELLWPEGFVEDGNLTQTVYVLRRLLDTGRGRRFIETLPRHGYRFAVPVSERFAAPPPRQGVAWRFAASAVLLALTMLLAGASLQTSGAPLSSEAAVSYAIGVFHWNMRTDAELDRSVRYFNDTVREAPARPLGYAGLADAYAIKADGSDTGSQQERRFLTLAERYRDEALARDPNNVEALTVAAFMSERFYNDFDLAEHLYARALTINPRYATAHHWHAVLRFAKGDIAGAVAEWEEAHRLEPTSEVISRWLGTGYLYARRPERAIAMFGETLSLQPHDTDAYLNLSAAQEQRGSYREALKTLDELKKMSPHKRDYAIPLEARIAALTHHGNVDPRTMTKVRELAAQKHMHGDVFAFFYAAVGRKAEAFAELRRDRSKALSPLDFSMIKFDPRLDSLRSDSRFHRLFD